MKLFAIDPGPVESAWVLYDTDTHQPQTWATLDNHTLLGCLDSWTPDRMAIEMVASYGMAVGADVFETCVWAGRFIERWHIAARPAFPHVRHRPDPLRVYRRDVKLHLCGSARAKDANIRQALIDRYGPGGEAAIGRKATPGPLYRLTGHCWSALAVAITAAETTSLEAAA